MKKEKNLTQRHRGTETDGTAIAVIETAPNLTPENAADAVNNQWQRAQMGLLDIVKFGAMMIELDNFLRLEKVPRGGKVGKGLGLQGWLSEHCPRVNYKTAMGYRDAARGLQELAKLPDDVPLLAAIDGALDDDKTAAHDRVIDALGGASIALLKDAKPRGGDRRSMLPPETEEEKHAKDIAAAKQYWAQIGIEMHDQLTVKKSHLALEKAEAAQIVILLETALSQIKEAAGLK